MACILEDTLAEQADCAEDTTVSDAAEKSRARSGNYRSLLSKARSNWLNRQLAANRKSRCRIVLTGGPGGGKTTAADLFRREIGERVVIVPESATLLFSGGFPRSKHPQAAAAVQQAIFHVQRQLEDVQSFLYTDRVLLCDRGTVDGAAYCPESPDKFFKSLGTSFEAELARYDGIIFFESAALGGLTIEGGNPIRNESVEQAVALDGRLRELWMHHPRFVLVRHDVSFFKKTALGLAELDSMVSEYAHDRDKETIRKNSRAGNQDSHSTMSAALSGRKEQESTHCRQKRTMLRTSWSPRTGKFLNATSDSDSTLDIHAAAAGGTWPPFSDGHESV